MHGELAAVNQYNHPQGRTKLHVSELFARIVSNDFNFDACTVGQLSADTRLAKHRRSATHKPRFS